MKVAKFRSGGVIRAGVVTGDTVQPVHQSLDELVAGALPTPLGAPVALGAVQLLAPLTSDCRGLVCTGINYLEHQEESADTFSATVPEHPLIFFKTVAAVAAPGAELPLDPRMSEQFDWEVELGVVIGVGGRDIAREDAAAHVYGFTVVNDITARDVQHRHKQWYLGKNVDAATPVGPWIVTADEFGWPPATDLRLTVNGVAKQSANTRDMIFTIADQIAVVSRYTELRPGDVLATGTPGGVGFARTPAEFLRAGDVVEATIDGIGVLRNPVAGVPAPVAGPVAAEAVTA